MKNSNDLLNILNLEQLTPTTFSGVSKTIGSPNVFGGQVLAQALNAAYKTVPKKRFVHSLHAYFLRAGDLHKNIFFEVENLRDGGSFSTRRVTAKQNDKVIFILAASFHKNEEGYDFQIPMKKNIPSPEVLMSWTEMLEKYGAVLPKALKSFLAIERPVEFKPTYVPNITERKDLPPNVDVWFKLKGEVPKTIDLPLKQQILTYISDYNILTAALNPHASKANFGNTQMASLDHSMWFYRDFDFSDWLLYSINSPNTFGARGFAQGNIFTRNGTLVASVAQEGLMRPKR
ncbi:acyl-CoA thioesterase [Tenacibaculum sp. UWU-22]|uniref:acyl-CoA thioesterase n=1 Tax=Tenacibaculum sp. UWU-22 TaxID=3234187 RepID=UPI0034DB4A58